MKLLYCSLIVLFCVGLMACDDDSYSNRERPEPNNPDEPSKPLPTRKGEYIAFNIDGNYIRAGRDKTEDVVFTIDGNYIRAGEGTSGDIIYNIDGRFIRAGATGEGGILYNIDDKYICVGDKSGYSNIAYSVYKDMITMGDYDWTEIGKPIAYRLSFYYDELYKKVLSADVFTDYSLKPEIPLYTISFNYSSDKLSSAKVYARNDLYPRSHIYTIEFLYNSSGDIMETARVYAANRLSSNSKPVYSIDLSAFSAQKEYKASLYAGLGSKESGSLVYTMQFDRYKIPENAIIYLLKRY